MKNRTTKDEPRQNRDQINGSKSINDRKKMKKKNTMRLGGGGLSLEAFANAKSKSTQYNPALIKKQREFYKNAKYVSKYKKSLKQKNQQNDLSSAMRPHEDDNETGDASGMNKKNKKNKKNNTYSLKELYEKKQEEEEKARMEREAIIQVKKEEKEKAKARRKVMKEKMFKKTRSGQPIMKYRIEHLLETIEGSTKNSVNSNP